MQYQPFFVTGIAKSGTTWLGMLLDAHPQISCKGEACVHFFGVGLSKLFKEYDDFLKSRLKGNDPFNQFSALDRADFSAVLKTFIERRLKACEARNKPKLRFVGEKDPGHLPHLPMLADMFPEAKFIHIIRDGRDVAISSWHHNQRAADNVKSRLSLDDILVKAGKDWVQQISMARDYGRRVGPKKYFELRYEDLKADTATGTERLLRFLGADATPELVARCIEAARFERVSGGRQAGEEDPNSFFRKGVGGEWRSTLTIQQIRRFNEIGGGLLRDLGYELLPATAAND